MTDGSEKDRDALDALLRQVAPGALRSALWSMGYAFAVRSPIDFMDEADEVESEEVLMSALTVALGRPATD